MSEFCEISTVRITTFRRNWLSISRLNHSRVGPRDTSNKSVWHLAGVTNRGNKVNWNTSSITRSAENTCTSRSSVRRLKTRTRSWHTSIYTTGWVISGTTWCSHDTKRRTGESVGKCVSARRKGWRIVRRGWRSRKGRSGGWRAAGRKAKGRYNNDGKLRVSMLRGADRQHLIQFDCDTVQ